MRAFLLITYFFIQSSWCFSQQVTGKWIKIYEEGNTKLEIQYTTDENVCANGTPNYFNYKISGAKKSSSPSYVTFKMNFYNCNGTLKFEQFSINIGTNSPAKLNIKTEDIDFVFSGKLDSAFYDVKETNKLDRNSGDAIIPNSVAASSISGSSNIYFGESASLNVTGGTLGVGADWFWYENKCGGKFIGRGKSISVYPLEKSFYYVRAEGKNNTTDCVEIIVNVNSKEAESINGPSSIYEGESTNLSVKGGVLNLNSKWVWYEGSYNNKIGEGNSVTVTPTKNSTYYVRAEESGKNTKSAQLTINVLSRDPESVFGPMVAIIGESITLTVKGGFAGTGEKWVWYEGSCGGNKIGEGKSITVMPFEATEYYVRAEGVNRKTLCAEQKITVLIPDENSVTDTSNLKKLNPQISNVDFAFVKGKVEITFDILYSKPSDKFNISLSGLHKGGGLKFKSVSGDLNNIGGGKSKKIIWDASKDDASVNEKIFITLKGTLKQNISLSKHVVKSLVFPGWGDIHLRNNKASLIYGVVGFSSIASAIYFNQEMHKKFDLFNNSNELNQSKKYYDDAINNRNLSRIFLVSAALVWTIDIGGVVGKHDKVKKNISASKYYLNRSVQNVKQGSKLKMINTMNK